MLATTIMNDDTSVDAQRAEANKDDWHLVTDTKKRKQIQDRLAQRARRKYHSRQPWLLGCLMNGLLRFIFLNTSLCFLAIFSIK